MKNPQDKMFEVKIRFVGEYQYLNRLKEFRTWLRDIESLSAQFAYRQLSDKLSEQAQQILKDQKDDAEKPGPAHLREEVSPQEWRETSSTGRERAGQIC